MINELTVAQLDAITLALSSGRLATFDAAAGFSAGAGVLDKYSWHALTSAAFFASLHICEVAIRNGVDTALQATYGPSWPWSTTFERSLPNPLGNNFNPKKELLRVRGKTQSRETGRVIAELRFAFWCHMFTSRYQVRVWDAHIATVFPALPPEYSSAQARHVIHMELDSLRKFRNRIAHHEPIFADPLLHRHQSIRSLVNWRCPELHRWHSAWEIVTLAIEKKP